MAKTFYVQRIKNIIDQERKSSNKTISLKKFKLFIISNIVQKEAYPQ